jgi:hypothetical protein
MAIGRNFNIHEQQNRLHKADGLYTVEEAEHTRGEREYRYRGPVDAK